MTQAIREISPVRREIDVEVPAEEWGEAVTGALRDLSRKVRLPGFRPGKVPMDVIRRLYGAEVEADVFERLVPERAARAISAAALVPLARPALQDRRMPDGSGRGLAATFSFEVRPTLRLEGYTGLELTRRKPKVDDAMVASGLEQMRERAATFAAVEGRPAEVGDYVVVDMTPTRGAKERNVLVAIKGGDEAKELDRALVGRSVGDETTVTVREEHGAGEHEGHAEPHVHERTFKVRVQEIKRRELPALDDAFAREVGPHESLEQLRAQVREDLLKEAERRSRGELVRMALEKILATNPVAPPETLVERELEQQLRSIADGLKRRGLPVDRMQLDWERMAREMRPDAEMSVRLDLVFDAIADAEKIQAPEERIEQQIQELAGKAHRTPAAMRAQLERDGQLDVLRASLRRERSIDFVLDHARVTAED